MTGKVINFLSIGGPNMGVTAIPHCFNGIFCDLVNRLARSLAYGTIVQNFLAPAGYFRDPDHMPEYLQNSVLLAKLNNEVGTDSEKALSKKRFSSLKGVMLVMFK